MDGDGKGVLAMRQGGGYIGAAADRVGFDWPSGGGIDVKQGDGWDKRHGAVILLLRLVECGGVVGL